MAGARTPSDAYGRIYQAVRAIPRGRVATYGQVASLAGIPGHARQVGYALHALPEGSDVPWHRVVNFRGRVSLSAQSVAAAVQRGLLQKEGVRFLRDGSLSLARFQWRPSGARPV
jgi:methylated-DNA-protein-cysteine methyltransferase-like protein